MLELVLRLVFSLAVVIGIVMVLARLSGRRFRGSSDALVRVLHRQPLSRTSAVAVVSVGSRVLVLGTTEQQVQLLAELDPAEVELDDQADPSSGGRGDGPADGLGDGAGTGASVIDTGDRFGRELAAAARRTSGGPVAARAAARAAGRHARVADGALAGSLLSVQTWRQAVTAATGRVQDAS